jgi:putative phage-type endonuclease
MNAPTREEFLQRRMAGIGGSDIAAILGLSPYKTGLQLWMEKTGRDTSEPDSAALERMHWGTALEDVVARHYSEVRGVKIQRINQQLVHPQCAIALANIDRAVLEDGKRARWDEAFGRVVGARNVLEVKTAHALAQNGADWGEAGTDEVPQHYWTQCQWYMGITGLPFADLAVLFGGQKFVIYTIPFERDLFDDMLAEADRWWKAHVVADLPPQATTEGDARRMWKSHAAGREKIVDVTVAEAVETLRAVKAQARALEEREQAAKDVICAAFEDAEVITYMGRKLATWKQNKASQRTDWKASADQIKGWMIENEIEGGVDAVRDIINSNTIETEGARVLRLATIKE